MLSRLPDQPQKKGIINMLKRFVDGAELPAGLGHLRWQYFLPSDEAKRLFRPEFVSRLGLDPVGITEQYASRCPSADDLERELYVDLRFVMADSVLMKVDKMSMAHALEVRVPFLDHEFQEFCATIPPEWKLHGLHTKVILRSALRSLLPPKILSRKKQGYSLPIKNWLREDLRDYMIDLLTHSPIVNDCCQANRIREVINEHLSRRVNHNHLLWALMNLALWYRMYIEADTVPRVSVDKATRLSSLRDDTGSQSWK
jgi:asparagine synthase (glutamine-hydrolysing)